MPPPHLPGATVNPMALTLRARVRGGRLVLDEPVALPEGSEVDLVLAEELRAAQRELDARQECEIRPRGLRGRPRASAAPDHEAAHRRGNSRRHTHCVDGRRGEGPSGTTPLAPPFRLAVRYLSLEVVLELAEAIATYEQQREGRGDRFENQVRAIYGRIDQTPASFPLVAAVRRPALRRAKVIRFPYSVFFYMLHGEAIIVAVSHDRQRPGYWRRRV